MSEALLEGVRVLDMTNVLSGPFAGYQLALMSADVAKLEVPASGDLARQLGAALGSAPRIWACPSWHRTRASAR